MNQEDVGGHKPEWLADVRSDTHSELKSNIACGSKRDHKQTSHALVLCDHCELPPAE